MTNLKSTSSTILVATLILSSGGCFTTTDAFVASSLRTGRSSSSGRFYAPKDGLDGGSPERLRGRPRKIAASNGKKKTKTTAKSFAFIESDPEKLAAATASRRRPNSNNNIHNPNDNNQIKVKRSRTGNNRRGLPPYSATMMKTILNHELLTKKEEYLLGTRVRRAAQIQDAMAVWVEENRSRILQKQEYHRLEGFYFGQREMDNPLFGTVRSRAMEDHFCDQGGLEDLFYQDGTRYLGAEEETELYDYTVYQPRPRQIRPPVRESWIDGILLQKDDSTSGAFFASSIMTDDDVQQILDLPGGRSELRQVLLEGALAREKLIRSNVKLVWSIAKKWVGDAPSQQSDSLVMVYNGAGSITGRPTLDEALQEGILGLAEAAERFDPDRGFRFSTYATLWVTNSIRKSFQLESTSGIRLPIPYYDLKRNYVTRVRYYLNKRGEVPSMSVLAEELGVSESRLLAVLRMTQPLASLDSAIQGAAGQGSAGAGKAGSVSTNDDGYTLASLLPCDEPRPEDHVERSLLRQCLENAMATELSPNERDIVRLRLGLDDGVPQTAKEVAEIFGGRFTHSAIRAIEQRAFNKLRSPFGVHTQQLMAYLDFAGIDGANHLLR